MSIFSRGISASIWKQLRAASACSCTCRFSGSALLHSSAKRKFSSSASNISNLSRSQVAGTSSPSQSQSQSLSPAEYESAETVFQDILKERPSLLDSLRPEYVEEEQEEELSEADENEIIKRLIGEDPSDSSISSAPGMMSAEEYEKYKSEPLKSIPTFEEVKSQVDELLRMEWRGKLMFPSYMHHDLRVRALKYMQNVLNSLLSSSTPFTQHELHVRLFTFFLKTGSKLARTEEERVTILSPMAPAVGEKRVHPEWPEMTTIVRRYFTTSKQPSLQPGAVLMDNLKWEDSKGEEDFADLNSLLEMIELARTEERKEAVQKLKGLKGAEREKYLAQLKENEKIRQENVKDIAEERKRREDRNEWAVSKVDGGIHQLAVVYELDSSKSQFECRYPLTKRDVIKLRLFEEEDDKEGILIGLEGREKV